MVPVRATPVHEKPNSYIQGRKRKFIPERDVFSPFSFFPFLLLSFFPLPFLSLRRKTVIQIQLDDLEVTVSLPIGVWITAQAANTFLVYSELREMSSG